MPEPRTLRINLTISITGEALDKFIEYRNDVLNKGLGDSVGVTEDLQGDLVEGIKDTLIETYLPFYGVTPNDDDVKVGLLNTKPLHISEVPAKSAKMLASLLLVSDLYHDTIQRGAIRMCEEHHPMAIYQTQYSSGATQWRCDGKIYKVSEFGDVS